MKLLRDAVFFIAAVALAAFWFALLRIPWATRKMLLGDPWSRLLILCAIGLLFAIAFKRWTVRSFSFERGAAMALLIPLAGAVLFSSILTISEWTSRDVSVAGLVFGSLMTLVYVLGAAYYVVLPMGAMTVFLMRKLAVRLWPQPRVAGGEEFWW